MKGDLTQGPILKTLIAFSIPMLLGNAIQTLNGSINAIWVGRLIGESGLAATTNANGVMFLTFAVIFGLGSATTIRVGQHFGARNIPAARSTFGSGLGFCFLMAVAISTIGYLLSPLLLHLLATPKASLDQAQTYLRVTFAMMPFGTMSMMLGMGLRGGGDSKTPLHAMVLTVALDIILNPLLIRGWGPVPTLGIAGSALSTGLASMAGIGLTLYRLYRYDLPLRLRGRTELGFLIPRQRELSYVVKKGLPMGGQMLLVSTAQMVMVGLVNREGINSTAAYGASMQLWNYLQMPAFAISTGVSAMVAQSIGAGNHGRVSEVTHAGMISNLLMTGVLGTLIVGASHPLLALFLGGQSPALPIAQHIQYVCTWTFLVMGASMVATGTMRAYGAVMAPLIIQGISLYLVRLGFYFVAYSHIGSEALWWSFPVASSASALLTWVAYRRGSWVNKRHLAVPA